MNSNKTSIAAIIRKHFNLKLDCDEYREIFRKTVLHFAGVINAYEYQKWLNPYCLQYGKHKRSKKMSGKDFRLILDGTGYCLLNLKLFCMHTASSKSMMQVIDSFAEKFAVSKHDLSRLKSALSNADFRRDFRKCSTERHMLVDFRDVDTMWEDIHLPVFKYIKHLTYQKLRFITKSTNGDPTEFHNELFHAALRALYKCLPTDLGIVYVRNFVKRAVHNRTMNIIEEFKRLKRARLVEAGYNSRGERQFSLLEASCNQMNMVSHDGEMVDYINLVGDNNESGEREELRLSVEQVLKTVKTNKSTRFIKLLMGNFDSEFTTWLREAKLAGRNEDNVDVQMRVTPKQFNEYLVRHLKVSAVKVERFIERLKRDLCVAI